MNITIIAIDDDGHKRNVHLIVDENKEELQLDYVDECETCKRMEEVDEEMDELLEQLEQEPNYHNKNSIRKTIARLRGYKETL